MEWTDDFVTQLAIHDFMNNKNIQLAIHNFMMDNNDLSSVCPVNLFGLQAFSEHCGNGRK